MFLTVNFTLRDNHKKQPIPTAFSQQPASHTLESTVAYRDELTNLYYEETGPEASLA